MKTNQSLHETYGDILKHRGDPSTLGVVASLDRSFAPARAIVPPTEVLVGIDRIVEEHRAGGNRGRRASRPGMLQLRQPLSAMAALLLVLVLAGAAYRAVTVLEQAFNGSQGERYVVSHNLVKHLNISQASDGYTITLKGAYADSNSVVLAAVLHGPGTVAQGTEFSIFPNAELTDANGVVLHPASGCVVMDGGVCSVTYGASGVSSTTKELRLHWVIRQLNHNRPPPPAPSRESTPSPISDQRAAGPFVFDFTVPVQPSRVAEPNQTVTVGGAAVTLERVVISPAEARFYLQGLAMSITCKPSVDGWDLDSWRAAHPATEGAISGLTVEQNGLAICSLPFPLMHAHGPWTLRVEPDTPLSPGFTGARSGGPWVFHFTLPQPGER